MPRSNKRNFKKARPARAMRAGGGNIKGKGDFSGDVKKFWLANRKYLPRALGAGLGSLVGARDAGHDIGSRISKDILGWGDYGVPWKVNGNSLVSEGNVPTVHGVGESGMRVVHKEFIGVVNSSTTFSNTVLPLNPGIGSAFPWLSKIAVNFQQYMLHGAVVTFVSSLTNAVATFSSLGAVIMACDLNPAATPASSQTQLEQMQFVASSKPNEHIVAPIECSPAFSGTAVRYVRNGPVPVNGTIQNYDHGIFQVATVGQPSAGVVLGRLYISYDITLLNPKLLPPGSSSGGAQLKMIGDGVGSSLSTVVSTYYDTLGLDFPVGSDGKYNTLRFPYGVSGTFTVTVSVSGGTAETLVTTYPTTSNCGVAYPYSGPVFANGNNWMQCPVGGTSSTARIWLIHVSIPDPTARASIAFASGSLSVVNYMQLEVIQTPFTGYTPSLGPSFSVDEKEGDDGESVVVDPSPVAAGAAAGSASAFPTNRSVKGR